MDRHPHILNASTNLLGICLGLITALRLTHFARKSLGDEVAWMAAAMFLASTLSSFVVIRSGGVLERHAAWVDRVFILGVCLLILATALVAVAVE